MKCLLVDDEPGIREGLAVLLRRRGHDVRTAADCQAAASALAEGDFDAVVTDWRLPDGTAGSFLEGCRVPAIAVSGHPEEVDELPALRAVLRKPVLPTRLLALLAEIPAAAPPTAVGLPGPVQALVDGFVARLPAEAAVELFDDGTFVTVAAEVPAVLVDAVRPAVGDWRSRGEGRLRRVEWRIARGSNWENTHVMPMKDPVGTCLPAELADLWS
jgi:CheY-like chemotaxis protein